MVAPRTLDEPDQALAISRLEEHNPVHSIVRGVPAILQYKSRINSQLSVYIRMWQWLSSPSTAHSPPHPHTTPPPHLRCCRAETHPSESWMLESLTASHVGLPPRSDVLRAVEPMGDDGLLPVLHSALFDETGRLQVLAPLSHRYAWAASKF